MKPDNFLTVAFLLSFLPTGAAHAQPAFDATYDFDNYYPQQSYSSASDGEGGYRVFRFNYNWADSTQGIAGVRLDSAGEVLDVSLYAGPELGIPHQAFRMPDSTTVLLVNNSILRLGPSGEVISLTTLHTIGNYAIMRIAPVGNEVYVAINTYRNSPSFHILLTLVHLGTDGSILQQCSVRNDSANFQVEALMALPATGPVLVGRSYMVPCKVAALAFDNTLDVVWAKTGPEIPYESNVPVLIKPLQDGDMAMIWDADLPDHSGGLMELTTEGEVVAYHTHTMKNVGDAAPLPDGGWLFLHSPGYNPAYTRHFGPNSDLLGSGTVSGLFAGEIHQATEPGWWDVLSGTYGAGLSMAHFNVDDGTCLVPPVLSASMSMGTAQLQTLQLEMDTTLATAIPGICSRSPLTVTRTMQCGFEGMEELLASNTRCQQIEAHGPSISVALRWDQADVPEVQLFDAMGRLLPSSGFQWEAGDGNDRVFHLRQVSTSGIGILRITGKHASTSCKLVFGPQ